LEEFGDYVGRGEVRVDTTEMKILQVSFCRAREHSVDEFRYRHVSLNRIPVRIELIAKGNTPDDISERRLESVEVGDE
jgi:hypothetical protein